MNQANVAASIRGMDLDIEAAIDSCGSSLDALRECVLACRRTARRALDAELHRVLRARGHDSRVLCARELTARIGDLNLCELLQIIALGRKDAIIDVYHGSLASRVWCSGGEIVDAVSGRARGEPAAYRILGLDRGDVLVDFRAVRRPRAVRSSTHALMLEALRRKDECAVIEKRLGGLQRVYCSAPEAHARVEAGGLEAALLTAFEAGARIESVLDASDLDDLGLLQAIAALVERGDLIVREAKPTLVPPVRLAAPLPRRPSNDAPSSRWPARRNLPWSMTALAMVGIVLLSLVWSTRNPSVRESSVAKTLAPEATDTAALPPADAVTTATASLTPPERAWTGTAALGHTYPVQVVVEPTLAQLWLDGTWLATGELAMILPLTGETHELRILAPGHKAETILFRDNPPPRAVQLEAAKEPPSEGPS